MKGEGERMEESKRCTVCGVEIYRRVGEREMCNICKGVLGMVKWDGEWLRRLAGHVERSGEGEVMKMRKEGKTYEEIGKVLGVARQRAHQIMKCEVRREKGEGRSKK